MREFKFRAWHLESKSMTVFDLEKASKDQYIASHVCALLSNTHSEGEGLMMQFTGLTDKNGVEIYEGDLIEAIRNKNGALLVEFVNDYVGGWVLSHPSSDRHISLGARNRLDIEVIGNFYENPELLKAGE